MNTNYQTKVLTKKSWYKYSGAKFSKRARALGQGPGEREREIMLFIGKPIGRSLIISNTLGQGPGDGYHRIQQALQRWHRGPT